MNCVALFFFQDRIILFPESISVNGDFIPHEPVFPVDGGAAVDALWRSVRATLPYSHTGVAQPDHPDDWHCPLLKVLGLKHRSDIHRLLLAQIQLILERDVITISGWVKQEGVFIERGPSEFCISAVADRFSHTLVTIFPELSSTILGA